MSELERARDLEPFSIPISSFLGLTLYYARRYEDALHQFRRGLEMHPDRIEFHEGLADVYEQKRMFAEAFAERQQALSLNKDTRTAAELEEAYRRSGYRGHLRKRIESRQLALEHADRGAPALFNEASPEQYVKSPARLRRFDRQGIFIPIWEQKKCIRLNQIASVIESPLHFAIANRFN